MEDLDLMLTSLDALIGAPEPDLTRQTEWIAGRLEGASRWPWEKSLEVANQLLHVAEARDLTRVRVRAQLLVADQQIRGGQGAIGGMAAREVQRWARQHQDGYVQARSHRVLATFYWRLGDQSLCLEQAIDSVRLLPEDAPSEVRADHQLLLADALGRTGALDSAIVEYHTALDLARETGRFALPLVVLNNMVHNLERGGRIDEALNWADKLQCEYNGHASLLVVPAWAETVARVQIASDNYDQARNTLEWVFDHEQRIAKGQAAGLAECYLCYSEVQRRDGRFDDAGLAIKTAEELVQAHGIEYLRVQLFHEKATVLAAQGDMGAAYQAQRQAFLAAESARTDEREAKSKALWAMHATGQAHAATRRFRTLSFVDPLTGLGNRRFVSETLDARMKRSATQDKPLAVVMLDIDRFKAVNDEHTHRVGDLVLQDLAGLLATTTKMPCDVADSRRESDSQWVISVDESLNDPDLPFAARMGGEEFLIVLPDLTSESATAFCQALLQKIRTHQWLEEIPIRHITASAGLAMFTPEETSVQLLDRADRFLYQAKSDGRDRFCGP